MSKQKQVAAAAAAQKILQRCAQDPGYYIFEWLRTKDEHDKTHPVKKFPDHEYLRWVINEWHNGPQIVYTVKSRQLMVSWLLAAYGLWTAQFRPHALVLWQTKKQEDAAPFIYEKTPNFARMSFMLSALPDWLRVCRMDTGEFTPIADVSSVGSYASLMLPNGSQVLGLAQGASQVESKVPTLFIADEASLQTEFASAMAAAKPALDKDAKGLAVGTMRMPSDFGDDCAPSWDVPGDLCGRGISRFTTKGGAYGIRVHYSADPTKDPETPVGAAWKRGQIESGAYPGGEDGWRWQQHMEINPAARAGTLCITSFKAVESRAVIDDLTPRDTFGWSFDAGLDWGVLNRAVFELFGMRPDGRRFLLWEFSEPGGEIGGIPGFARAIQRCPWFRKVNGSIQADPSLWNRDQSGAMYAGGLTTRAQIFADNDVWLQPAKLRGQEADEIAIQRLNHYYWAQPEDPLFFVCKNAKWFLRNVPTTMYEEWSEALAPEKSFKEKMKDLNVDEWDAFKYAEVAWPDVPKYVPQPEPGTFGHYKMRVAALNPKGPPSGKLY